MPFNTALSGLNAASADLSVTANNIANSATTGFKQSRAEFADVFATAYSGMSRTAIGSGVRLSTVSQQFTQGISLSRATTSIWRSRGRASSRSTTTARGSFTREGAFQWIATAMSSAQRENACSPTPCRIRSRETFNRGSMDALRLNTTESAPQATSAVEAVFICAPTRRISRACRSIQRIPRPTASRPRMTVYDSLGRSHTGSLFFRNVGPLAWESH
jgi:flagellar hook protein FlgE